MTAAVRKRNARRTFTDGPFVETKEQLAGFSRAGGGNRKSGTGPVFRDRIEKTSTKPLPLT